MWQLQDPETRHCTSHAKWFDSCEIENKHSSNLTTAELYYRGFCRQLLPIHSADTIKMAIQQCSNNTPNFGKFLVKQKFWLSSQNANESSDLHLGHLGFRVTGFYTGKWNCEQINVTMTILRDQSLAPKYTDTENKRSGNKFNHNSNVLSRWNILCQQPIDLDCECGPNPVLLSTNGNIYEGRLK
jgi:hypothetical protein